MKKISSINECQTIDDFKDLQRRRYQEWYSKKENREKRLEYYKEYYKNRKLKKL